MELSVSVRNYLIVILGSAEFRGGHVYQRMTENKWLGHMQEDLVDLCQVKLSLQSKETSWWPNIKYNIPFCYQFSISGTVSL